MTDLHPDATPQEYEPPAIVPLGSLDDLTQGVPDRSSVEH